MDVKFKPVYIGITGHGEERLNIVDKPGLLALQDKTLHISKELPIKPRAPRVRPSIAAIADAPTGEAIFEMDGELVRPTDEFSGV